MARSHDGKNPRTLRLLKRQSPPRRRDGSRGGFFAFGIRRPTPSRGRAHPPTRCHRGAGAAHLACQERADHRQLHDRESLCLHLGRGLHGRLQPAGRRHAGMASDVSNSMTEAHDGGAGQDGEGSNSRAEHIDSPVGFAAAHGGNPWPWRAICQLCPAYGCLGSAASVSLPSAVARACMASLSALRASLTSSLARRARRLAMLRFCSARAYSSAATSRGVGARKAAQWNPYGRCPRLRTKEARLQPTPHPVARDQPAR